MASVLLKIVGHINLVAWVVTVVFDIIARNVSILIVGHIKNQQTNLKLGLNSG